MKRDSPTAPPVRAASSTGGSAAQVARPRVLVFCLDSRTAEQVRDVCETLDCDVSLAFDHLVATTIAGEETQDLVFLDAAIGERRAGDTISAAKSRNPNVAVILLATPEQAETQPTLLMLVGYEYLTLPVRPDVLSAEVRLRLEQQRVRRVSAALASTLEYRGLLTVLLRLAVQEVHGQTASVLMPRGPDNALHLEAALGLPDDVVASGHEPREDGIAEWVFEHGEPLILQGGFADIPLRSVAGARRIASAMILPLEVGRRSVGVLCVGRIGDEMEPFTLRQLRAMEGIASQAAVAIHNAQTHEALLEQRKWEHELEVARSVQGQLLATEFPRVDGVELAANSEPARQIGGDFYFATKLDAHRLGFAIADVSGKGIPGALLMIQSLNDLRRAVEDGGTPGDVLTRVNTNICAHATQGMFVTLCYGVIDARHGVIKYANAGHLPMLRACATGEVIDVASADGPPLGILPKCPYATGEFSIAPGELLVLYTDGVIEAQNTAGEEFGQPRLRDIVAHRWSRGRSVIGVVLKSVQAFAEIQPQHDDLTLMTVRYLGLNGAP